MQTRVPKAKILIIDDDDMMRELVFASLSRVGFACIAAQNGQEGLAMAQKGLPALIVLDHKMPVMDGPACLEKLKADERTAHTPVIMLSGGADMDDATRTRVVAYVGKPFKIADLVAQVCQALDMS